MFQIKMYLLLYLHLTYSPSFIMLMFIKATSVLTITKKYPGDPPQGPPGGPPSRTPPTEPMLLVTSLGNTP